MERAKHPIRRCAVYTRKSSEEGLEQDFNSLQRAARGLRSVHRKPAGGRVEANQGRLRRWRHFGRYDGAASPATAAG
jgi:hypothetical protein